jgi:ribosomal protein S28E/S33
MSFVSKIGAIIFEMGGDGGMTLDFDYIVDLSNVCRSRVLGAPPNGASLRCLHLLEKTITKSLNGRAPVLQYVADTSLWGLLEVTDGKRVVKEWKQRKHRVLFEDNVADGIILKLASTNGTKVITSDFYRDHRRPHPWLQNNSEDFFEWKLQGNEIVLITRTLEALSEYEISHHEERKEIAYSKLDPSSRPDREILETLYQCENMKCDLRKSSPSYLPLPPIKDRRVNEVLNCPECKKPVRRVGFVGQVAQLKFKILETGSSGRITFQIDQNVVVGRNDILRALSEVNEDDRKVCELVSGNHLQVLVSSGGVKVADSNSTNGSTISRINQDGVYGAPTALTNSTVGFNHGDKIYLGGVVEITRSGRRFGYENLSSSQSDQPALKTQVREN